MKQNNECEDRDDGEVVAASSKSTGEATDKDKVFGKKHRHSSLDLDDGHKQVGGGRGSPMIMRNPYLPSYFHAYSPSSSSGDGQLSLSLSPLRHFEPPPPKRKKQQHHQEHNPLWMPSPSPLPTYSPVRNEFGNGNQYYISPRSTSAPAALYSKKDPLPLPSAAAAAEAKEAKKETSGNGESFPLIHFPRAIITKNKMYLTLWDQKFDELLDFKKQQGHCNVPQKYAPNPELGVWVNKQRQEHKKREDEKTSAMTDERLKRLQSIGFTWAQRKGQKGWNKKYDELLQYKAKFGNCHVPTKFKENTALGRWVSQQRAEYKKLCKGEKTSLTTERISKLDSIGFAWFLLL